MCTIMGYVSEREWQLARERERLDPDIIPMYSVHTYTYTHPCNIITWWFFSSSSIFFSSFLFKRPPHNRGRDEQICRVIHHLKPVQTQNRFRKFRVYRIIHTYQWERSDYNMLCVFIYYYFYFFYNQKFKYRPGNTESECRCKTATSFCVTIIKYC